MIATTLHDDVLEIRMDNPPLNVMSRGLRIDGDDHREQQRGH